jgi:hypothetical protein
VVALLAVGSAYALDRLFQPESGQPVQLKTVPAATLSQLGVTAAAAQVPAYCQVVGAAADHGLGGPGPLGCPISRQGAEAAARQTGPDGAPKETVLARVTAIRQSPLLNDRLVWLVVLQGTGPTLRARPAVACPVVAGPGGGTTPTPICASRVSGTRLVFVDARSAAVLAAMWVGIGSGGTVPPPAVAPAQPTPIVPVPIPGTGPVKSPVPVLRPD